jgi:hypothetical protein
VVKVMHKRQWATQVVSKVLIYAVVLGNWLGLAVVVLNEICELSIAKGKSIMVIMYRYITTSLFID